MTQAYESAPVYDSWPGVGSGVSEWLVSAGTYMDWFIYLIAGMLLFNIRCGAASPLRVHALYQAGMLWPDPIIFLEIRHRTQLPRRKLCHPCALLLVTLYSLSVVYCFAWRSSSETMRTSWASWLRFWSWQCLMMIVDDCVITALCYLLTWETYGWLIASLDVPLPK